MTDDLAAILHDIRDLCARLRNMHGRVVDSSNKIDASAVESVLPELAGLGAEIAVIHDRAIALRDLDEAFRYQIREALNLLDKELADIDHVMRQASSSLRKLLDNQATRRRAAGAYGSAPPPSDIDDI